MCEITVIDSLLIVNDEMYFLCLCCSLVGFSCVKTYSTIFPYIISLVISTFIFLDVLIIVFGQYLIILASYSYSLALNSINTNYIICVFILQTNDLFKDLVLFSFIIIRYNVYTVHHNIFLSHQSKYQTC